MKTKSQQIKAWPLLPLLLAAPLAAQPVFDDVTPTANPFFVTSDEEDFWLNAIAPADIDGTIGSPGARRSIALRSAFMTSSRSGHQSNGGSPKGSP